MVRRSIFGLFLCATIVANAQTVGLLKHTAGSNDSGYVMFAPLDYPTTYLIDKCGNLVHTWPSDYTSFFSGYLLDDGSLLLPGRNPRPGTKLYHGTATSVIEKIDWNGNVVWQYAIMDSTQLQHHDIRPLPNGNILVLASEAIPRDAALAAGKDPAFQDATLLSEEILEIKPVGTDSGVVVWRWRAWDHLVQDIDASKPNYGVIANAPGRLNVNYPPGASGNDWLHVNSVSYNAALDQIMLSSFYFNELWIIDHGTTTAEAALDTGGRRGKGGDILYRYGNPEAYGNGTAANKQLYGVHAADWIPPGLPHGGDILVFNNGSARPTGSYSSLDRFSAPVDSAGNYSTSVLPHLPHAPEWSYTDSVPQNFFCAAAGSTQVLSNGNIVVCNGLRGVLFEIDSLKHKVWEYMNPVNRQGPVSQGTPVGVAPVFRCTYVPASARAFQGRMLVSGAPIELNPLPSTCKLNTDTASGVHAPSEVTSGNMLFVYPNPANDVLAISGAPLRARTVMYNTLGQPVREFLQSEQMTTRGLPAGSYRLVTTGGGATASGTVLVLH